MSEAINYPLEDFAGSFNIRLFAEEVGAEAGVTETFEDAEVKVDDSSIDLIFDVAPTGASKTALDGVVAAHNGENVPETARFLASSKIQQGKQTIVGDASWDEIGGVVTQPDEFHPDMSRLKARVRGSCKTTGATGQVRLVQEGSPDTQLHTGDWTLPDTSGAWQTFDFLTDVDPSAGESTFRLDGRLNGATAVEVRFVSLTMLLSA
jgi:hypothetical protein